MKKFLPLVILILLTLPLQADPYSELRDEVSIENLQKTIRDLSEFSPRMAGSESNFAARDYLVEKFSEYGYEVFLEEFRIDTYEVFEVNLTLTSPLKREIEVVPSIYSYPTKDEKEREIVYLISGTEEEIREKGIEDKIILTEFNTLINAFRSGVNIFQTYTPYAILVFEWGKSAPSYVIDTYEFELSLGFLSSEDAQFLMESYVSGEIPRGVFKLYVEKRESFAYNVVALLKGSEDQVIVGGHYDTVWTQGAIDNGSGVAAMLEIARMMVKRPHEATLVFVAFSGEEEGLFGSEEYVRKHLSEMPQVLGMICLDGIGGGERIVIGMTGYRKYATTEELDSQVKKLAALLGYTTLTESFESGTSDYASFTAQGVPSTLIYSSPLDRIHTLEDTYENVNWELLRDATVIGAASVYALSNGELSKVSNIVAPNPFLVIGGSVLLIFLPIGILFYYKKKLNLRVEGIILVGILSFLIVMVFDLMLFRRWFAIWFSSLLKSAGLENPLENFYLPSNVSDAIIFIVLILITYFILTSLRDLFRTQSAQEKRYDWGVTESTSPMNTHTILEAGPTALTLALKNLSRRKLRTLLTITSVGVTLSAFLLFVQVSHDVELFVTTQEISIPINAVTIQGQRISSTRTLIPLPIANFIEEEYGQNTQVLKRLSIGALGKTIVSEKTSRFLSTIIGIDPKLERETTFMDGIVVEGKFLLDISRLVGNPILLSKPLAQELGVGVSDEVRIGDRRFDVFGIFSEEKLEKLKDVDGDSLLPLVPGGVGMEAGISTLAEPRYTVIVPLHVAQSEYYPTLSKLILITPTSKEAELLGEKLVERYSGGLVISKVLEGKITKYTKVRKDTIHNLGQVSVILLIVALSILNTIINSVQERVREIGTLSSIGASPSQISQMFLTESLLLGVFGGALSFGISIALTEISYLEFLPEISEKLDWDWFALTMFISLSVCLLAAFYPASKASWIVTPSMRRRWSPTTKEMISRLGKFEREEIPIMLRREEFDELTSYIKERLDIEGSFFFEVHHFWRDSKEERELYGFTYEISGTQFAQVIHVDITLELVEVGERAKLYISAKLHHPGMTSVLKFSSLLYKKAYEVMDLVRRLVLEWRAKSKNFHVERRKVEGNEG